MPLQEVQISEFYVALALPNKNKTSHQSPPTLSHLEALRVASNQYLLEALQTTSFPNLSALDLTFTSLEYQTGKPAPQFDVYWQGQATATFDEAAVVSSSSLPLPEQVFETVVSLLGSKTYLVNVVRARASSSPLAKAVEVQARRLKRPTAGGTVQAPAFYMAFYSKQQQGLEEPSAEDCQAFLTLVQQAATKQLEKAYPETFRAVEIKIVKVQLGAGIPEKKFNIYVELQALANFSQDTPEGVEIFQVLTHCINEEFMNGLDDIGGCCFVRIVQMVMRLCIIVEVPALVPAPPADGNANKIIIRIYLEFFVALVVQYLLQMPTDEELEVFHKAMQEYFTNILAAAYPGRFVDMVLESDSLWKAGRPLERFNLLHQYHVTLRFYQGTAPAEPELMKKFTQCNVPALVEHILHLLAPWKHTQEVTLGKAAQKPPTDETYSGKIEEEGQEQVPEKPTPKSPQKKKLKPRLTPKKTTEQPPAPTINLPEVPALVEVETPKEQTVVVGTSDVFMAYSQLEEYDEPSKDEYEQLAATSSDFYTKYLKKEYPETFVGIQVSVRKTAFRSGIPSVRYHVYVEWDIEATFKVDPDVLERQSPANKNKIIPDSYYLCRSLIASLSPEYLIDHVCSLKETPFAKTCGVYTEQVVKYSL